MDRPRVALMQPTFLPWQGYFGLLAEADVFVFLDDFQFCRRSVHHRNRLFVGGAAPAWLTLPVEHAHRAERPILREVRPRLDGAARRKLLGALRHGYARSAYFGELYPEVERWLERDWSDLASLNIAFIELASRWLGTAPRFERGSALGVRGARSNRIADLLHRTGAGTYLAARGSLAYMVEDGVFPLEGVDVHFQEFDPQPYPQRGEAFIPQLSVLDALFRVGPAATRELIAAGQRRFAPWDELVGAGG